jgi:hypothetical protein
MPTQFWARHGGAGPRPAKLAAGLFVSCIIYAQGNSVALPSGGTVRYSTVSGKTRLEIASTGGAPRAVTVARDETVAPETKIDKLRVIGVVGDRAVVLVDTYPSKPLGLSYCQAGEEQFLRVIALSGREPKETLRVKLASCRQNIELASPGLEWKAETTELKIHWLMGPSKERTYKITSDGKAELEK